MKREQTTCRLYFRILYCTGTKLAFIGWFCGTEPISSFAMPVSKYGGETFFEIRLCLAPSQEQLVYNVTLHYNDSSKIKKKFRKKLFFGPLDLGLHSLSSNINYNGTMQTNRVNIFRSCLDKEYYGNKSTWHFQFIKSSNFYVTRHKSKFAMSVKKKLFSMKTQWNVS